MNCLKCGDKGGRPIDWTDGNHLVHHDWAWCDCQTARDMQAAYKRAYDAWLYDDTRTVRRP